jgi:hypothetical protein
VRKDPTELVDSEMGMHLGEGGQHLVASGANVSLSSLLISYAQITEPRKQAKVKQFLQRLLVWGLLTKRRCAPRFWGSSSISSRPSRARRYCSGGR